MVKQFELTLEQLDAILVDELKEAVEHNWNSDHDIVEAAFTLLAYYMTPNDYMQYREDLKTSPPRDSTYNNTN